MTNNRHRYYTLLQVGRQQLGWDDDVYRAFLAAHGAKEQDGHVSATTMSIGALVAAVEAMKAKGFKPASKRSSGKTEDWRTARVNKIIAIWCQLADAGVMYDRSEKAMLKFCAAITGKARLEWASSPDLNRCIEVLKDKARHAGVTLNG
ncbi:MAG: regulatory protein GemA [Gammaproteobacteria bacterium]|nr:regulatory protein GemA [Gammaproteobacteria bacterium]